MTALDDATTANARAQRRSTVTLVSIAVGTCLLVLLLMGVWIALSWDEMRSDDPLAGVGILVTLIVCTPFVLGAVVSLLALPWASRRGGPIVAGIGLAISAVWGMVLLSFPVFLPFLW